MKKLLFSVFVFALAAFTTAAQTNGVSINANGAAPHPSAMLDVSGTSSGVLINRMTTSQRDAISNPAIGLQVFNTTTNCINMWTGATWKQSCFDCDFTSPIPGNNGPICQGSTLNLTATTILGATYSWTGPNGFTSNLQNPTIENATSGASGSYSVTATLNGCTSQSQSTVATVNSTPVTPIAGNDGPTCVGDALYLSASTIVGATYSWTGPNGYSSNVQSPIISSAQLVNAGTFNVVATVNGCLSAAGSTSVVINAIPATPGSITGTLTVCQASTGNSYSISPVSGATSYNWTVPSGSSITANNGTSVAITYGANSGNVTVSAVNVCGSSQAASAAITVVPLPASTFTPTSALTGYAAYFVPATSGATYSWTFPGGSPSSSNAENPNITWSSPGTQNVSLTVTSNGCSSTTTVSFNIVDPTVQTFNVNGSGGNGSIQTFTVPNGVTTVVIEAFGGRGGIPAEVSDSNRGLGARMRGTFNVTPGSDLKIVVGQQGTQNPSGNLANGGGCGGGGSFVWVNGSTTPLIVAGGGGGGSIINGGSAPYWYGKGGSTGTAGLPSYSEVANFGTNGGDATYGNGAKGWNTMINSLNFTGAANSYGGYGGYGGGGSMVNNDHAGGGGGGYSGGGGGQYSYNSGSGNSDGRNGGGGGGSFNAGTNQSNSAGVNNGNGVVTIAY